MVSLKPKISYKNSEAFGNRRYKSVNHRTIARGDYDYINNEHVKIPVRHNVSQAPNGEKLPIELPELSRRSDRKRIKISQSSCKKKLPMCFSICSDATPERPLKKNLNSTLDINFRKVYSEQVSPRNLEK